MTATYARQLKNGSYEYGFVRNDKFVPRGRARSFVLADTARNELVNQADRKWLPEDHEPQS